MPSQLPPIGAEVPQSTGGGLPPIGGEVQPTFRASNERDTRGNPVIAWAGDYLGEATKSLNPKNIYHALKSVVTDLSGTVRGIGEAQGALYQKAEQSYQSGDYMAAARHMVNYLIPLLGPRIDEAGDFMQQGEYAKGLGAMTDVGVQIAAPAAIGRVTMKIRPLLKPTTNPLDASAVRFGESRGIPIDAGTKTGKTLIRNTQKRLEGTIGGSAPLEASRAAQGEGLARTGQQLVTQARPGAPVSPVTAGEGVTGAFMKKIQDLHDKATAAYDHLRQVEQAQAQTIAQVGGVRAPATSARPFTNQPLAVDLAATKAELRPLYDRMMREKDITPPMGGKAKALTALDRLMNGPDVAPLSLVDEALGDLKSMARGADMPELRTGGQARAALAVKSLDAKVRAAAAHAGPDVLKALEEGRAATMEKYAVADALDLLSDAGPVQVYKQLTATKDLGLSKLRAVQKIAPKELPNIARAYLEEAMDLATQEGGFGHADRLWSDWQKMGPLSKKMLFPKRGQVHALDDFFLLAKKLTENRNPSGTANVANSLNLTQVAAYLPSKALAIMLTSPSGVKALTTGLRASVNASPAARTWAASQVLRAAKDAGVPTGLLPTVAADTEGESR